jgi:anti-sigma factor RsiW
MSCDTEEILLYVDGELAPRDAARVRAHIAVCAACRDLFLAEQSLERALDGLGEIDPPEGFADATVTRARCDLTHAVACPRERRRAVAIVATLTTATLFLLWPTGLLDPALRALAPLRCMARFAAARLDNSAMGLLIVGRTVTRHLFDEVRLSVGAVAVLLALLVIALVWLLGRYHGHAGSGERGAVK